MAGQHGTGRDNDGGDIAPGSGHDHARDDFITSREHDHAIQVVGFHHHFYGICNVFPAGQGIAHAVVALTDSIT